MAIDIRIVLFLGLFLAVSHAEPKSDDVNNSEPRPPSLSPQASNNGEGEKAEEKDKTVGKEDNVFVLTDDNFDAFLASNPTALVEFYAPWCGHCKKLAPEFSIAAKILEASVPLAKLDATVHPKVAKRFDVSGYPTLKLFKEGDSPVDYDGGRDSEAIVEWVKEKTDPSYKPPPEEVVTLTVETFDEFIADKPIMLVEFYAPWCGHCKQLAPEFEKAAKTLKEHKIPLAKVDATVEKKLADQYGVKGFPTLKILRNGRRFDYDGPREASGIVDYMLEQAKPAVTELASAKEAQKFFAFDDVTIIGFFKVADGALFDAFVEVADRTRGDFKVGYTTDASLRKHFNVDGTADKIVVFFPEIYASKYEPKFVAFDKESASAEDLLAFWRENATPLVGRKTRTNAATRYAKLPLVVVYYNVDFSVQYRDGTQYWRQKVLKVANEFKGQKYRFAIADEEEFAKELVDVGLGDSGLEHNVIVFGVDGKKYPMDGEIYDSDDLEENLENFLNAISKGKVKPHVKSAPAPKDDKSPVKAVVASTFDKIVNDETKDVLIEFYAPWCGHCKSFEPKYKQFAAKHKSEQPNFVVAKFDATANDAPANFPVEGFPTIYFAPAGDKSKPVKYNGNRDLKDLEDFVANHATASFQKTAEREEL